MDDRTVVGETNEHRAGGTEHLHRRLDGDIVVIRETSTADNGDIVVALVEDQDARQRWQQARGKGGLRRSDWDTVLEIIAADFVDENAAKNGFGRPLDRIEIEAVTVER